MPTHFSADLDSPFKFTEGSPSVRMELLAGITTFIAIANTLILTDKTREVNPLTIIAALIITARYAFMTLK